MWHKRNMENLEAWEREIRPTRAGGAKWKAWEGMWVTSRSKNWLLDDSHKGSDLNLTTVGNKIQPTPWMCLGEDVSLEPPVGTCSPAKTLISATQILDLQSQRFKKNNNIALSCLIWFVVICYDNNRQLIHVQNHFHLNINKGILGMWSLNYSSPSLPFPDKPRLFVFLEPSGYRHLQLPRGEVEIVRFMSIFLKRDVGNSTLPRIWPKSPKALLEGRGSWKEPFEGELLRSGRTAMTLRESVEMPGQN